MQWNEERVRKLLARAESTIRSYRNGILGAKLGLLLRQFDREFHPRVLGDASLKLLLARFPDLGSITEDIASNDFRFLPPNNPGVLPAGAVATAPASIPARVDDTRAEIEPAFWDALTRRVPSQQALYVDLHNQQPVHILLMSDGRPGAPVADEPERYLRVSPVPEERLCDEARTFIEKTAPAELKEQLLQALQGSFNSFESAIKGGALEDSWQQFFRQFIEAQARAWLSEHGLRPGPFFRSKPRLTSRPLLERNVARQPRTALLTGSQLRRLILEAVRRMPEEDLLSLQIPLRYLVEREPSAVPSSEQVGEHSS